MSDPLIDGWDRERFRDDWTTNFAVSANAGSGKTTAISERLAAMARAPATSSGSRARSAQRAPAWRSSTAARRVPRRSHGATCAPSRAWPRAAPWRAPVRTR